MSRPRVADVPAASRWAADAKALSLEQVSDCTQQRSSPESGSARNSLSAAAGRAVRKRRILSTPPAKDSSTPRLSKRRAFYQAHRPHGGRSVDAETQADRFSSKIDDDAAPPAALIALASGRGDRRRLRRSPLRLLSSAARASRADPRSLAAMKARKARRAVSLRRLRERASAWSVVMPWRHAAVGSLERALAQLVKTLTLHALNVEADRAPVAMRHRPWWDSWVTLAPPASMARVPIRQN